MLTWDALYKKLRTSRHKANRLMSSALYGSMPQNLCAQKVSLEPNGTHQELVVSY